MKMRRPSAIDAGFPLWWKKRRVDVFDASSCIEETFDSASGCSVSDVAKAEIVRRFRTYCNVPRISWIWELHVVAYRCELYCAALRLLDFRGRRNVTGGLQIFAVFNKRRLWMSMIV